MSTPEQNAAVVIGLREIYDQLVRLTSTVGEMRADLRAAAQRQSISEQRLSEHAASDARELADHETRIRLLERRAWVLAGSATVLGAGGGYLATMIGG